MKDEKISESRIISQIKSNAYNVSIYNNDNKNNNINNNSNNNNNIYKHMCSIL